MLAKLKSATKVQAKHIVLAAILAGVCFSALSVFNSPPVHAASPTQTVASCKQDFFGLEPWYQYMGVELVPNGSSSPPFDSCEIKCFNVFDSGHGVGQPANTCGQTKSDIPLILLAVIDDLLRISGLTAVAFVIYGAFQYVGSQGNSEVTAKAQSMVINALIGLAIASVAVVVVNFIGNNIGT
jgi:hypothetical protein